MKYTSWFFPAFGIFTLVRGGLRWSREPGATTAYVLLASGVSMTALGVASFLARRKSGA